MRIAIANEPEIARRPKSIELYYREVTTILRDYGVYFYETNDAINAAHQPDLIWAPGLGLRRTPAALEAGTVPKVATIHGLHGLLDPPHLFSADLRPAVGHYLWRRRIRDDWRRIRHEIDAVIAVSHICRDDIAAKLGLTSRIEVIYHGVDHAVFHPPPPGSERAGVFHVSQYSGSKNLHKLLEAWRLVSQEAMGERLEIVSIGAPPLSVPPCCVVRREPMPRAVVAERMQSAKLFAFPSQYESFGLPVIEAMASGTPVVTSRGTGAAEVAGDAAILVDPNDPHSIAEGLLLGLRDEPLRRRMTEAGIERARRFTWAESARQHYELFRSLINGRIK